MTTVKKTTKKEVKEVPIVVATYSKEQLILSKKYRNQRDLLNALLENDKQYSLGEVDKLVDNFMKGKVK